MGKGRRSSKGRPGDEEAAGQDAAIEADVHAAMRSLGWAVPQSDDDVREAEAELAQAPVRLPDELADPGAVFAAGGAAGSASRPAPLPAEPGIAENLARAARDGGRIPPEIEERMRQDREAAERELTDGREDHPQRK